MVLSPTAWWEKDPPDTGSGGEQPSLLGEGLAAKYVELGLFVGRWASERCSLAGWSKKGVPAAAGESCISPPPRRALPIARAPGRDWVEPRLCAKETPPGATRGAESRNRLRGQPGWCTGTSAHRLLARPWV